MTAWTHYHDSLRRVLTDTCAKKGTLKIACAELKVKLQDFAYRSDPSWEFDEQTAARALHPEKNADFYLQYRFREFCEEFPDLLQLDHTPSGDFATLKTSITTDTARDLLQAVLRDYYIETGKFDIACSALKVRMRKASKGEFEEGALGYSSFRDYLKAHDGLVRFVTYDSGGRVQFVPPENAIAQQSPLENLLVRSPTLRDQSNGNLSAQKGYLLIDGDNIRSTIYKLLGHKPQADQLPRWELVLQAIKKGPFVALEWKAIYFLGIHGTLTPSAAVFRHSLTLAGYEVVSVRCDSDLNAGVQTEKALLKTVTALAERGQHVIVVSHSAECGRYLDSVLTQRANSSGNWGVVGLKELMAPEIHHAVQNGLHLLDLERDFACIPSPLPRHIEISADDFDPEQVLN